MTIKERIQNIIGDPGKRAPSIGAAFLLSFTLLFFGPSYMYYGNILEIPYYYSDMVWIFLAYSLAAAAIISLILLILKGTIHQRAVALVFALGLLFWIQGHILVWDYGILDGREIIWNDYLLNGIIDSAVWIAVLGVALFKGPSFYKHIAVASVLLLVVQGGGLAAELYQAPDEPEWKSYAIGYDDETMFEFSKEQNVIILVLDAFQSDVFQEIIDEDDEYREMFDGFTYYRNAVGGFPRTYASVTLILTGKYYDNSIPIQDFIKNAFSNNSIPRTLKENSYQVDLYPLIKKTIYPSDEIASNIGIQQRDKVDRVIDEQKGAMELYKLTMFRHVPHILKRHFYHIPFVRLGENGDEHQDIVFYNTLKFNTTVVNETKLFKYYHLWGAHDPYMLDAQLQNKDLPQNRTGCKEQAKASLKIAKELVEQLRRHDVYDNSMILIIGDHGSTSWRGDIIDLSKEKEEFKIPQVPEHVAAHGVPLMLIKPFNSDGELAVSDAPVTLGDIPQTIASELQLSSEFPGVSILSLNESDKRTRKFFDHVWFGEYCDFSKAYFPPMTEYVINGHSWSLNSWESTHLIYESGNVREDIENVPKMDLFRTDPNLGSVYYDESVGRNVFFSPRLANTPGCLVYGPYIRLSAGDHTVEYMIKAANISSPDEIVATVDVFSTYISDSSPTYVVDTREDVYGRDLVEGSYTPISLDISIDTYNHDRLTEFRVFQPLHSDLYVKEISLR